MPAATPTIGDSVRLKAFPGSLAKYQHAPGKVRKILPGKGTEIALVEFEMEGNPGFADVPVPYLVVIKATQRRGVLNLHLVKDDRTEAERQAEGIAWLHSNGYTVLTIGQGRKAVQCPKCGDWNVPTGYVGNSPGCPDTLVTHDGWPVACGLLMEWKDGENGERRPGQEKLEERKRIVVVWDMASMLCALWRFERRILPLAGCSKAVQDWLAERDLLTEKD